MALQLSTATTQRVIYPPAKLCFAGATIKRVSNQTVALVRTR